MSLGSDAGVVPFTVFVERRERRAHIAATLEERARIDAASSTSSAATASGRRQSREYPSDASTKLSIVSKRLV